MDQKYHKMPQTNVLLHLRVLYNVRNFLSVNSAQKLLKS